MEIRSSELKKGIEVDSTDTDGKKYSLWWNPKTKYYEITDYAKHENVHYRYTRLRDIVRVLNTMTGWNDVAIEDDQAGPPNYWGVAPYGKSELKVKQVWIKDLKAGKIKPSDIGLEGFSKARAIQYLKEDIEEME